MAENKKVYVVGHKNPDTDSICTAIAYANLKTKITGETYEPVSYTHLDVYKRQALRCSKSSC